jgi:hypothetical protein
MRMRRTVLSTIALALLAPMASAPAVAKAKPKPKPPKPVCNLITDETNDSGGLYKSSKALDVTSADVATGKKTLVAVVRVQTTDMSNDTWAPVGYSWFFGWTIVGTKYAVSARRSFSSADMAFTYKFQWTIGTTTIDWPSSWAKPTIDKTSYKFVVPRSAIPGLKKSKQVLVDLQTGSGAFGGNADQASSAAKYPDLYPSCVKAA